MIKKLLGTSDAERPCVKLKLISSTEIFEQSEQSKQSEQHKQNDQALDMTSQVNAETRIPAIRHLIGLNEKARRLTIYYANIPLFIFIQLIF
ncbi:hypothetical protein [Undibacterium sp. Ji49W]|uniref:hypothetical protein n=1 Tax=Undibacterium sp. Ji49W TaxID=3413040 RepID=UPI003BF4B128